MSLRRRILYAILLPMALVLVLLTLNIWFEGRERARDLEQFRIRWAQQIIASWQRQLVEGEDWRRAIVPYVSAGIFSRAVIFGRDGKVVLTRGWSQTARGARDLFEQVKARGVAFNQGNTVAIPLAGAGHVLVAELEMPEPYRISPVTVFLRTFTILLGGTLALGAAAYWLMTRYVLRPLSAVVEHAGCIQRGDYSRQVARTGTGDEVEELILAFNAMLGEINRYRSHLEGKVAKASKRIKKTEQSLVIAQRLAATGTLAAGIAHEVNNPLGGMLNAARALGREDLAADKRRQYLDLIVTGLGRVQETVRKILQFSPRKVNPRETQIAPVVAAALDLVRHRATRNRVELVTDIPEDLPDLVIDPLEIQQVFLNLVINSIDAIGEREGTVSVTARVVDREMRLAVADDGCGMDQEQAGRAIDLFFTTKDPGKGTGLGLSIVHNIVTSHGGDLEIRSKPGEGTTVEIRLPVPSEPGGSGRQEVWAPAEADETQ